MPAPKMGRPRKKTPIVHRVHVARPARKDSRVIWTTKDIATIKETYGERILSIEVYERVSHG